MALDLEKLTREPLRDLARDAGLCGWGKLGSAALRQFLKDSGVDLESFAAAVEDVKAKPPKDKVVKAPKARPPKDKDEDYMPYWKEDERSVVLRNDLKSINQHIAQMNALGLKNRPVQ